MKISVCIPSANPDLLKLCLSSLKVQTKKPFEILVSRKIKPLAEVRSLLLQKAKGDLIVLTDDDVIFPPTTLERIEKFFKKNKDKNVVQGAIAENFLKLNIEKTWEVNYLDTIICVLRKKVAKMVKLKNLDIHENIALAKELKKLGYKLWMTNSFYVYHLPKYYERMESNTIRNVRFRLNEFLITKNPKILLALFLVPLKNHVKSLFLEYKLILKGLLYYFKKK